MATKQSIFIKTSVILIECIEFLPAKYRKLNRQCKELHSWHLSDEQGTAILDTPP